MSETKPERSAVAHFSSGIVVVVLIGLISWFLHTHEVLRNLEMINLDILFLSQGKPPESESISVVPITEEDYKEAFASTSPLSRARLLELIRACALSGAKVLAIDLDTSDWTPEDRAAVAAAVVSAASEARVDAPRLAWAVGGYFGESAEGRSPQAQRPGTGTAGWHLDDLHLSPPACQGVPASLPDQYGIVRGYIPAISGEQGGRNVTLGNLAVVIKELSANSSRACDASLTILPVGGEPEDERLVNYAGGGVSFPHVSASTVMGAATAEAWQKSNPLKGRAVIIGGSYRAARDKYVTPVGYMDGVEILALTAASLEKGITAPTPRAFLIIDLTLGLLLLTATWFLNRTWALLLTFVLIPFLAILVSFAQFHTSGYFVSFVPILLGVVSHRVVEFVWEHSKRHREMAEELARLRHSHKV